MSKYANIKLALYSKLEKTFLLMTELRAKHQLSTPLVKLELIFHSKFLCPKKLVFANEHLLLTFSKGPTPLKSAVCHGITFHLNNEVLVVQA